MAKRRNRLTNSSDENDIANVISGDNVFTIPYFQRAYRWKSERLKRLEKDILDVIDSDGEEMHFLGAIIVHGRRSNPSDPDVFDVIDGQQRITTLFIYLCAIVKTLCQSDQIDEAVSLFQKYLVIGRKTSLPSNFKLHRAKRIEPNSMVSLRSWLLIVPSKRSWEQIFDRDRYLPPDQSAAQSGIITEPRCVFLKTRPAGGSPGFVHCHCPIFQVRLRPQIGLIRCYEGIQ